MRLSHHDETEDAPDATTAALLRAEQHEIEQQNDLLDAALQIERQINRNSDRLERLPAVLGRVLHRTLQQRLTVLCLRWLQWLATSATFDARNESSVMLARRLAEPIDQFTNGTWTLPRI